MGGEGGGGGGKYGKLVGPLGCKQARIATTSVSTMSLVPICRTTHGILFEVIDMSERKRDEYVVVYV